MMNSELHTASLNALLLTHSQPGITSPCYVISEDINMNLAQFCYVCQTVCSKMAQQLDQEQFCCSICLDQLKDPVTVPCGHNYCMGCIKGCWDREDQKGVYSCPQCRETFNPRPVLKKNNMLAEVTETLKKTGLQAVPPDHFHAGPGDVVCDVCTGRKLKAVKTCLQCLASYCDTHIQPHYQSPVFKKHKLVKASSKLQENICSRHDEVRKIFCRTDQQCICYLCSMEEHKGHDMISAAAERTERNKELSTSRQNIQLRIQEGEKDVKALYQEVESINHSADRAVENSDTIYTELITSIERKRSTLRELIRDQQKRKVSEAEEMRMCVEQEITELRRRHAELEQLSHTEDHIHFLHSYTSLPRICKSTHPVRSKVCPLRYFEDVTVAVSKVRGKLQHILKEEETIMSTSPEPKTRAEFLQYSCSITLDPNTAEQRLSLSKGNRKVTFDYEQLSLYPHHPERFNKWHQVLSRDRLTGRCYWEVKWSGKCVNIAVEDISRTGTRDECGFGLNDKSWSFECSNEGGCVFSHRGIETQIPGPVSSRVGVYLDHSAGTLSFYSISEYFYGISDTMTLLHKVQTTFTQTLYPGFWLRSLTDGGSAELCNL